MTREIKFRVWNPISKEMKGPYNLEEFRDPDHEANYRNLDYPLQYTGLKDKNGKEIYEGDIVTDGGDPQVVKFGKIGYDGRWNGLTGFGLSGLNEEDFIELHYHFNPKQIEVIGNIHENPELLNPPKG